MDNAEKTQKDIRIERLKPYRFTSTNQPKNRGRKKGRSPTDWLKKFACTKIPFQNPFTGKVENIEVSCAVAIQLILKATQDGDLPSIKEYFDRIDGKVVERIKGEGFNNITKIKIEVVRNGSKDESNNRLGQITASE